MLPVASETHLSSGYNEVFRIVDSFQNHHVTVTFSLGNCGRAIELHACEAD